MNNRITYFWGLMGIWLALGCTAPDSQREAGLTLPDSLLAPVGGGYRGIWYELPQHFEYGPKYSGGLGTYTAKHIPLAVYAAAVDKTFFVYGGAPRHGERYLLCMIGAYDHASDSFEAPRVVHDKAGVDDPHDDPSLSIDADGHLWVFVSGRARGRPGYKYRSVLPYDIRAFEQITEEEMTYPQPWYLPGKGFFLFYTKYTGVRELYFESSTDGYNWTEDQKLAGIVEEGAEKAGHYQVSGAHDDKVCTFFSRHPNGNVDLRTDLYYAQSTDMGQTWTSADGTLLSLPLTSVANPARVIDYTRLGKNVYLKDLNFDAEGNPMCLYLTSDGAAPGPENGPRQWKITRWDGSQWLTHEVCTSDHNYDMGSLYVSPGRWRVIAPTGAGPQPYYTGGEIELWESTDQGESWEKTAVLTQNSRRNHGYVRRPLHARDPFYAFWADGDAASLSPSYLYISDSTGERVRQLPDSVPVPDRASPVGGKNN